MKWLAQPPSAARYVVAALAGGVVAWALDLFAFGSSAAGGITVGAIFAIAALAFYWGSDWRTRRHAEDEATHHQR